MSWSNSNPITPKTYFDLDNYYKAKSNVVQYVIGSSMPHPILRRIVFYCGLLPNRPVDLRNSDVLGVISALLGPMPERITIR